MKMKKKGYAMGGMKKKGYAMGGMKKKMKAGGGVKKFQAGGIPTGMMTQEQIDDPQRAVDAGNRMSKMRAKEDAMSKAKKGTMPMKRPRARPTAPLTSLTPPSRPKSVENRKKMKAGGMAKKKGYSKGGKMGGKSKVRGAGIAQRGVRKAKMR
jgi:hypothetical protein